MADTIFEMLQNAKAVQELITQSKKIIETQNDAMSSDTGNLISSLEKLQETYQEMQTEKTNKNLELSNLTTELENLKESFAELKSKKDDLLKQIQDTEEKLAATRDENKKLSEQKDEFLSTKQQLEDKLVTTKKEIESSQTEINTILQSQDSVLGSLEENLSAAQQEIKRVKIKNAVLDFLLEESTAEIPEVDIITAVLAKSDRKIGLEELKSAVTIQPVTILRAIKQLEGIINYNEDNKEISL